jgi:hypothetical protein
VSSSSVVPASITKALDDLVSESSNQHPDAKSSVVDPSVTKDAGTYYLQVHVMNQSFVVRSIRMLRLISMANDEPGVNACGGRTLDRVFTVRSFDLHPSSSSGAGGAQAQKTGDVVFDDGAPWGDDVGFASYYGSCAFERLSMALNVDVELPAGREVTLTIAIPRTAIARIHDLPSGPGPRQQTADFELPHELVQNADTSYSGEPAFGVFGVRLELENGKRIEQSCAEIQGKPDKCGDWFPASDTEL